jgi:arylsulfatase A-like enzyme
MFQVGKSTLLPQVIGTFLRSDNGNVWRKFTLQSYSNVHKEALAMARDPELHLIMIHYPIPHPPGIYDRSKRDFSFNSSSGYLDNLQLADRALGELRSEIEQAGLWETTTVLISSDHWLRADRVWRNHPFWKKSFTIEDPSVTKSAKDERVPFVLKLAGEKVGSNYEQPFNTVLSHDLILAILSGEVLNQVDVANWLDQHRSIGKSPYVEGEK